MTQKGNMRTRQMTSFFHLLFKLQHSFLNLKILKIHFSFWFLPEPSTYFKAPANGLLRVNIVA